MVQTLGHVQRQRQPDWLRRFPVFRLLRTALSTRRFDEIGIRRIVGKEPCRVAGRRNGVGCCQSSNLHFATCHERCSHQTGKNQVAARLVWRSMGGRRCCWMSRPLHAGAGPSASRGVVDRPAPVTSRRRRHWLCLPHVAASTGPRRGCNWIRCFQVAPPTRCSRRSLRNRFRNRRWRGAHIRQRDMRCPVTPWLGARCHPSCCHLRRRCRCNQGRNCFHRSVCCLRR